MGHIQIFGEQLREKLRSGASEEDIISWVKEQVLQSYRNGLALNKAAGADGERVQKIARRNYKQ